jgi:pimeloyl-ACP methyl ester carboxylesterase
MNNSAVAYGAATLAAGIRSRFVDNGNGLEMHVLEAGHEQPGRPVILLLHGFPELAFSWRKLLPRLAQAGYHVFAPDQRGYGRTTGWDDRYDGDVRSFRYLNLAQDAIGLLSRLNVESVEAVVGHDFGSPVAAWCALTRPDLFRSVVLMSAPFPGPPADPAARAAEPGVDRARPSGRFDMQAALAALPRPRKQYMWHYASPDANQRLLQAPQGLQDFLRAYYHVKSADWAPNDPRPLRGWTAEELARLPNYYVMDLDKDMPATVAPDMPSPAEIDACAWLTDAELSVYVEEYARTGFQGGLNWYRCAIDPACTAELAAYAGRRIEVPACFIAGRKDWGVYQTPGTLQRMETQACARYLGTHLLQGAGHWVQQEQPETSTRLLLEFLARISRVRSPDDVG